MFSKEEMMPWGPGGTFWTIPEEVLGTWYDLLDMKPWNDGIHSWNDGIMGWLWWEGVFEEHLKGPLRNISSGFWDEPRRRQIREGPPEVPRWIWWDLVGSGEVSWGLVGSHPDF